MINNHPKYIVFVIITHNNVISYTSHSTFTFFLDRDEIQWTNGNFFLLVICDEM